MRGRLPSSEVASSEVAPLNHHRNLKRGQYFNISLDPTEIHTLPAQDILEACVADIQAVRDRDPACFSFVMAALYFKGFQAGLWPAFLAKTSQGPYQA